ncbi:MAG: PEP-CTERM sorting domain-containing protein [Opitutales bacterium]
MKTFIAGAAILAGSSILSFGQADVIDLLYGATPLPGGFLLRGLDGELLDDGQATGAFGFIENSVLPDLGSFTQANLADFQVLDASDGFIVPGLFAVNTTIATTQLDGETNLPFIDNSDITFFFVVFDGPDAVSSDGVFVATASSFGTIPAGVDVPVADAPDVNFQVAEFDQVVLSGPVTPGDGFDPVGSSGLGVSYQLAGEVIPEPTTYAAIFGLLILGFAALRRRTRRS